VGDADAFRNVVDAGLAARYRQDGWWSDKALADFVDEHVATQPEALAFVAGTARASWRSYRDSAQRLAGALIAAGLSPGQRVAVCLPDGIGVHAAYLANELAGLVSVGIGARAGMRELEYLVAKTQATTLVTGAEHGGNDTAELVARLGDRGLAFEHHVVLGADAPDGSFEIAIDGMAAKPLEGAELEEAIAARRLGPDDLFIINSTSGTTGMPKCVQHIENRHYYINEMATMLGDLNSDDVFMSLVPAPFGFGLWTAHFTPTMHGAPTVLMERFSTDGALRLIEAERVSVLCCVSTQFIMMLNSQLIHELDLSSLRVMFTGGEAVPFEQAREFEARTGSTVLQFYGSNESGVVTGTSLRDSLEHRLGTAGTFLPGTELRLFQDRVDVTSQGYGQPGSRGPATCMGYLDDDEANAALYTDEGFLLHADNCTLDDEGYLRVVGRTTDLIIRGGKNISAVEVEAATLEHPAVSLAAAVPVPDPIFGERVGVFVQLAEGTSLELDELRAFLVAEGASKDALPEYLFVRDELPRSSGAKVAKSELRREARGLAPSRSER
jgi:acyl-CoA synthetase